MASEKGQWSTILVDTFPPVTDPREMQTILTFSLRDLFGDFEPHSCLIEVSKGTENLIEIKCPTDSAKEIQAALTMVTPPPYMENTQYRFDVVNVEQKVQKSTS
ncbi:expressed unknown protein [Seminavis robusta]|uniref:Uncharacterized protein n=1 Tax=Seminavis robusta TaxID=568900 RepID=A0A9N8E1I7_9STRA|nr:expressed unknown protein [Seminavis robusta]|eukprot:Sro557_g166161.1  (104) ;mRNA; f:37519-37830